MGFCVRVLLDTCSLIWLTQEPAKLSDTCKAEIDNPENSLVVSHASVWEILLKNRAGKFTFPLPIRRWLEKQKLIWDFEYLAISLEHLLRTGEIEGHHNDPFDRLLVAQSIIENISILTPDSAIAKYPVHVIW